MSYIATIKRYILQKQNEEEVRELSDRGYKWELYQNQGYKGSGGIHAEGCTELYRSIQLIPASQQETVFPSDGHSREQRVVFRIQRS